MTRCLDANVWVYYLDADLPEHAAVARTVDEDLADEAVFTTTVLQMEVVHYVANTLAESEEVIDDFLSVSDVVADLTAGDIERAAELLHEYSNAGLGGRDASVLAAMERCDVDTLWTHDRAFGEVAADRGVSVRDPVEDPADGNGRDFQ